MTIAELFVKIGLVADVKGIDSIEGKMQSAAGTARKLAIGLTVIDTALIALMKTTLNVAVGFTKFRIETGLSTDELQRWQYAARLANVAGSDVAGALKTIQDAQAAIALGEGNIAPWQLLGIDPRTDPFTVLEKIHEKIQGLNPAIARHITSQMGISDDMFQFLRRESLGLDEIREKWMMTRKQEDDLMRLNVQWQAFTQHIEQVAMRFAMSVAPAFERLIPVIESLLDKGSRYLEWLMSADPAAVKMRQNIVALTEALLIAAPALTAIATAMTAVSTALTAISKLAWVIGLLSKLGRGGIALAEGIAATPAGLGAMLFGATANEAGAGEQQWLDRMAMGDNRSPGQFAADEKAGKNVNVNQYNTINVAGDNAQQKAETTASALTRQLAAAHDQAAKQSY